MVAAFRRGAAGMRTTTLLLALALAALAALAAACSGGGGETTGSRLTFDGDSFDVGNIPIGETVERTIEFRNEGQEPLTVSIVKVRPAPAAACGCGIEGFEVRPETVPPGGTGELVFAMLGPEGMENLVDEMYVDLESNDPSGPERITLIFTMVLPADREG